MSAYIADRDALAKALAKWLCSEKHNAHPDTYCCNCLSRAECVGAPALIASGAAVIDASALADDQPLVYRAARWLYAAYDEDPDKGWLDESEHARTTWSNDARDAFRALAAALTERPR